MKNKLSAALLIFIIFSLFAAPVTTSAADYTVVELQNVIDGITDFKVKESGCESIDEWIETELPKGVGVNSEWYAIALSQSGYKNFAAYETALLNYIDSNTIASASSRERIAAALCAVGSDNVRITELLENSIDKQGIMSRIFGLHLMNNGYTCQYSADSIIEKLLSMQLSDGGWSVYGQYGDVDVTAMTVQALSPYISKTNVNNSIESALAFLSKRQQPDGGFSSMGNANPESAAQVLTALSALKIDCLTDERFIKNGSTVIDGILKYRLPNGGFSHTDNGNFSDISTVQVLYSLTAYIRMTENKGSLWLFDNRHIPQAQTTGISTTVTTAARTEAKLTTAAQTEAVIVTSAYDESNTTTSTSAVTKTAAESALIKTTVTISEYFVTSVTTSASAAVEYSDNAGNNSYKPIAVIVILGAAAIISLILFIIGKRSYKNFIAIAFFAAIGIAIVLLTDIKRPEDYYDGEKSSKKNSVGSVTVTIRCDAVAGKKDYIPDDGIILSASEFEIEAGDTVMDILREAAQTYRIQLDSDGKGYISGIASIYEFDFGDLSGWLYYVNGEGASVGCGEYELSDGDVVEWIYTCEMGKDIEEIYDERL
ncbi:MAG TPA: DUF4430 domain-containing protein [Ruminococcus sp.]